MNNKGIREIIEINKDFYSKHNESFDKSRSFGFWEGFEDLLEVIPENLKILDLGCGNARFLKFLLEKNFTIKEYLGIDNSVEFTEKNSENYKNFNFKNLDVITDLNMIQENFSLITAFGITHHIPNKEFRKEWFSKIEDMAIRGGFIILSFWNFDRNKSDINFQPKTYKMENGDYFLGWKDNFSSHRFCHYFSTLEINEIILCFKNSTLIKQFDKDQNTYLILQKNS
jgi:SAM-dependent methyltransferase